MSGMTWTIFATTSCQEAISGTTWLYLPLGTVDEAEDA
jgi:hypothetical protein